MGGGFHFHPREGGSKAAGDVQRPRRLLRSLPASFDENTVAVLQEAAHALLEQAHCRCTGNRWMLGTATEERVSLLLRCSFLFNKRERPLYKLPQADLVRITIGVQCRHRRVVSIAHPFAHADGVYIEGCKLLQLS